MTLRLYHDSADLAFDAQVIEQAGDPMRIVLDRTAFYPTSGGQPHDTGTLGGARVVDVIDDDTRIIHVVDRPVPLGPIRGEVDADRRRDFTVQHTAQHLVSALAADRLGWTTESVHFGAEHSTIEFDAAAASPTELDTLERWANTAIGAAIPVTVGYEDAAAARGLRKPTTLTGMIRIVVIEGLDRSACGGTHVTTTAQVGSLLLTGVERIRGRIRVGYLAGDRVRTGYRQQATLLGQIAAAAGTAAEEVAELVARRFEALRDVEKRVSALERELASNRVRELLREAPAGPGGVRRLVLHPGAAAVDALRQLAEAASAESQVLLVATSLDPATVIVAASRDGTINAGAVLKAVLATVGGRGGGSPSLAQGTVPDASLLDRVVEGILAAC